MLLCSAAVLAIIIISMTKESLNCPLKNKFFCLSVCMHNGGAMPGYSYNEYKYLQGLWCPQEGNFCGESNGGGYDQTKFVIIILPRECLSMGHGFTVRCHFIEKQHELCHPPLPRRSSVCASSAREHAGRGIYKSHEIRRSTN